jgi:hypothetical protein
MFVRHHPHRTLTHKLCTTQSLLHTPTGSARIYRQCVKSETAPINRTANNKDYLARSATKSYNFTVNVSLLVTETVVLAPNIIFCPSLSMLFQTLPPFPSRLRSQHSILIFSFHPSSYLSPDIGYLDQGFPRSSSVLLGNAVIVPKTRPRPHALYTLSAHYLQFNPRLDAR